MANCTKREIQALITLLGDDDPTVRSLVWDKIKACGQVANPILREIGFSDAEGKVRIAAQALLEEIRLETLAKRFEKISQASVFDLERACFLLAEIEYPNLDIALYRQKLDHLSSDVEQRLVGANDVTDQIGMINEVLFDVHGFRGNVNAYFDPENSYINKVMDSYLGIPISLSAIYLFIAWRLELPVHGVGFPGHFLLRYDAGSTPVYIDAFYGGRILSRNDCAYYLEQTGYEFCDSYLAIASSKNILARMIRNLVLIYHQSNQKRKIDILDRIFSHFLTRPPSASV